MYGSERTSIQLVSASLAICKEHWRTLLLLGFSSSLAAWLLDLPARLVENVALSFLLDIAFLAAGFAVSVFIQGAMIVSIASASSGRNPDLALAISSTASRFRDLFWASLRALAIVIGLAATILGLPWAINRGVKWYFVEQAILLDAINSDDVLDHSAALVVARGWWKVFWRFVATGLLIGWPSLLWWIFSLVLIDSQAIRSIGLIAVGAVTAPLFAAAWTLMYFDLRASASPASP